MNYQYIVVDKPATNVNRITLNRPEKRNAMSNALRTELFQALEVADCDPDVRVTILRGAGKCFSAGYQLNEEHGKGQPYYTAGGLGNWPRHVVEGCFRIWDLAKPVIAQVHGYCLAGGTELATACDLVFVADDCKIGYPVVRSISPPDNQFFPWIVGFRRAMELMLTGDHMNGQEAMQCGFANRSYPEPQLEEKVLEIAARVALTPTDLQQINKRAVHRQMESMGVRAGIRAGTEMQMLAAFTETSQSHMRELSENLNATLTKRDERFGDYRTTNED